jgi:hypothetical protein
LPDIKDLKKLNLVMKEAKVKRSINATIWRIATKRAPQKLDGNYKKEKCRNCEIEKPSIEHLLLDCNVLQKEKLLLKKKESQSAYCLERSIAGN